LSSLTWYLHLQQREGLHQEYGNPAEGVREHYEEEAVGHGHVAVQPAPHVRGVDARLVDGVEHAGVGHSDHHEGHQVNTCTHNKGQEVGKMFTLVSKSTKVLASTFSLSTKS